MTHLSVVLCYLRPGFGRYVAWISRDPLHLEKSLPDLPWLRYRSGGILEERSGEKFLRQ